MADDDFYFRITMQDDVVIATRSTRRYETEAEMRAAFGAVVSWLGTHPEHIGLVVDLRQAQGRNDAAFEEAVKPHRRAMFTAARRNVLVVRTAIGALQVKRHMVEDGIVAEVVTDVEQALSVLRS
jgi:hypothetical protein